MRKSFKYRLYPNKEQTQALERSLDLCRDLYNAGLQERRDAWRLNKVRISVYDQTRQLKDIRRLNPDYMQIQYRVCETILRQLDKSFKAFFRRCKIGKKVGFPRFKGTAFFNSFVYNRYGFRLLGKKIHLANVGMVNIRQHRQVEGTIKQVAVKREGSKWYAIISCDNIAPKPLTLTGNITGIDVGIESFATLSDGTQVDNWKYYESSAKQLRVAQRRVARRKKGSIRRSKAVNIVRSVHQKIVNQRSDFQHNLSADLIQEYDVIAIEKLNIKGMVRGALSKQISDVSWGSFFEKLRYKAENAGRQLIEVNPAYTSQDCSQCGNRQKKSLSMREHNCDKCGLVLHRDHNAAINILKAGLALQGVTYRATESVPCGVF